MDIVIKNDCIIVSALFYSHYCFDFHCALFVIWPVIGSFFCQRVSEGIIS